VKKKMGGGNELRWGTLKIKGPPRGTIVNLCPISICLQSPTGKLGCANQCFSLKVA
jgi:hypothetical protein